MNNDECPICDHSVETTNRSPVDTTEFLKKTVYSNLVKSKSSLGFLNNPEPVRPNVVSVF